MADANEWGGQAGDSYRRHLGTLPTELQRCGDAFTTLAVKLDSFCQEFEAARREARSLESLAAEAIDRANRISSVLEGPDSPPLLVIDTPVDPYLNPEVMRLGAERLAALEELERIRDRARRLPDRFEAEISGLVHQIRELTEWAPDEPDRGFLGGLIHDVTAPARAVVDGVGNFIEDHAAILTEVANLMSSVSGMLGVASLALIWMPGVSQALGAASLALAGTGAVIKTGVYATGATDGYGRPYVSGGQLAGAWVDVGVGVAAAGMGAAASRASKVASGQTTRLGSELAGELGLRPASMLAEAGGEIATHADNFGRLGARQWVRTTAQQTADDWVAMGLREQAWRGLAFGTDVLSPMAAPRMAGEGSAWDVGGLSSVGGTLGDVHALFTAEPPPEDVPAGADMRPYRPVMEG